jgi:hypothetical protein
MLHELAANPLLDRKHLTSEQLGTLDRLRDMEAAILGDIATQEGFRVENGADFDDGEPSEEGTEREMWMHRGLRQLFPGHCDRWRYYPRKKVLVIFDRKFGRTPVSPATSNDQLRSYAVQADEEWTCERIYVAIVQPRVGFEEGRTVSLYTREDLDAARADLLNVWDKCHAEGAPRIASPEACEYCKAAAAGCPQYRASVTAIVPMSTFPDLASLSNDELELGLRAIKAASNEKFSSALKKVIRERIKAGTFKPGYILKAPAPRREITDNAEALRILCAEGATPAGVVSLAANLSLGGIEELVCLIDPQLARKDAKGRVNQLLGAVIRSKTGDDQITKEKSA